MSLYKKMLGIVNDIIEFDGGEGGATLKYDGTAKLQIRNLADTLFEQLQAADPETDDDLVTLRYHNANPPAGAISTIEIPFDFNDTGTNVDSTLAAIVGGRVLDVKVDITTLFDAATTLSIGDTGDGARFVATGDVKETKVDLYAFEQYTDTIVSVFRVTVGASAATAGVGRVIVSYSVPTA